MPHGQASRPFFTRLGRLDATRVRDVAWLGTKGISTRRFAPALSLSCEIAHEFATLDGSTESTNGLAPLRESECAIWTQAASSSLLLRRP